MPEPLKNRIEDIKRHLYDREDTLRDRRREGVLHPVTHDAPTSWNTSSLPQSTPMKKHSIPFFKKFFIGAIIFFVATLGFGAYMYFSGGVSVTSDKIDIIVLGNAFTKGGEELPLQIEIVNRNNAKLELANLIIEYPRGANDDAGDMVRIPRDAIGTISAGESITRNVKVSLFGEEKSIRPVRIRLEYHPEGSNAIFTKETEYGVTISSAPLSLLVESPDTVTPEQSMIFTVTAKLNTTLPSGTTMLQIAYPNGFVFEDSVPSPTIGNSMWNLSSLTQANPIVVTVKGKIMGQPDDEQVFHVYAGTTSATNATRVNIVYNSLLKKLTLVRPFLETQILVNGQDLSTYSVSGGETVSGEILWTNNLSSKITDGQIVAKLSGNAFEESTVNAGDGFFDSAQDQIIWDRNTVEDLASIEPGARGSVKFSFKTKSFLGLGATTKDPSVYLDVSIRGRQSAFGSITSEVNNISKKVVKVLSDFQVAVGALHVSGPLPPKAEQSTRYEISWTLSNSSNTITQAQARAVLPVYVSWVGKAPGVNENITYNETTREVLWNIGTVRPQTGFSANREGSFIVSLNPSTSQVGSVPQLLKDTYLSGQDSFTGTLLKSTRGPLTTFLSNDPRFKAGNDRVVN